MMTTDKIHTGFFIVLWNDHPTKYTIVNGSRGLSGNGKNEYLIFTKGNPTPFYAGSLQRAKKLVSHWLKLDQSIIEG